MEPQAGQCYSGMPNAVYHGFSDWHGSTTLKHTRRSVESFLYEASQPPKHKIPFERGHAFHSGVEGLATDGTLDLFESEVFETSGGTVNAAAWKADKKDNPDKAVLPKKEIEAARQMAQNLYKKASDVAGGGDYFAAGQAEISFFWIDEETGIKLKCRSDWFRPDAGGWCLDYKSSKSHHKGGFSKAIYEYYYHFSAAQYLDGIYQVTGIQCQRYDFLVVANTPPFEVAAYPLESAALNEGRAVFRRALTDIHNYDSDAKLSPETIGLPPWGYELTERPDF